MADLIPSAAKAKIESKCKDIAKAVSKVAPGEKNEKKLEELLNEQCKKQVRSLDKTALKLIAEELKKYAKSKSAKAPPGAIPNVKAIAKPKAPGSGVPSLTIPLKKFMLNEKLGTTGKLELKIWADPANLAKSEKGVMLNFTVVKW